LHLLDDRSAARARKDWAASDSIRQKIADLGWLVQDTPEGQKIIRQ
jgi:cysteinyl-tRNA synthetase